MAACDFLISRLLERNQPDMCKRKKKSNERKIGKGPLKGKTKSSQEFRTGGLSEPKVVATHSGQSHSKTQRPGRIAVWQGFRWTINCRDIPPPSKDKA